MWPEIRHNEAILWQSALLHPFRDVCVQNASTGFRDMLQKRNSDRRTARKTDGNQGNINTPGHNSDGRGIKKKYHKSPRL